MKTYYILCLSFFVLFVSCGDTPTTDNGSDASTSVAPEEVKTQYLREPVDIVPSTGEEYPQTLIDIGFPVIPGTEITSVGNTEIENGTVVMQMESLKTIEEIKAFYDKEMIEDGWEVKEMKIFQGADAAYSYRNEDYSAKILVINDKVQDFRKLAITLNKRVNLEDYK
jgi:hypothetical protein